MVLALRGEEHTLRARPTAWPRGRRGECLLSCRRRAACEAAPRAGGRGDGTIAVFSAPQVDEYGTQQPIALLKLLLEKGFLYDRGKELNCKSIRDLGFVAAMGKAGGGRNEVDPRFLSLFSVFNVPFPSEMSLHLIYYSILRGHTSVTGCPCRLANGLVWGRAWATCALSTRPRPATHGALRGL